MLWNGYSIGGIAFLCASLALASLGVGCSDGDNNNPTGGGGGEGGSGAAGGSGGSGAAGGAGGAGGSGGTGAGPIVYPVAPEQVVKFDPGLGQLPEGIAIDGTTAYVSWNVDPKVVKIDLETNQVSDFGTINAPIGIGFPQGLALDAQKNLYVAMKSEDPQQFTPGIYKFPKDGGQATLWSSDPTMSFPRSIYFLPSGQALVAAPGSARIFTIEPDGTTSDPGVGQIYSGDQLSMCGYGGGVPYGVSSAFLLQTPIGDTLYMANADRATIFELGMDVKELIPGNCGLLGGAESLMEDPLDVSMLVAARTANKIVRVEYTGETQVLAEGDALYEPSAMAIGTTSQGRFLYITSSAYKTYKNGGIPGVVRIPLGGTQ